MDPATAAFFPRATDRADAPAATAAGDATAAILDRFRRADFWRALNPGLAIGDAAPAAPPFVLTDDHRRRLRDDVRAGRDFALAGLVPLDRIAALHVGIERLHAVRCPAVFLFVYDEPWQLFARAAPIAEAVLGGPHVRRPDCWAWRAGPAPARPPARVDRSPPWLHVRAAPRRLTLAIPLAAPRAGTVDGWAHGVHLWGTPAGHRAPSLGTGLACELERAEAAPRPDPAAPPAFAQRLALIGRLVLRYRDAYAMPPRLLALAHRLADVAALP